MTDLFNYTRRRSTAVKVGGITIGGDSDIRIQSMTTTDTNDTDGSVAQAERITDAGGELVRLTTQGVREAENMRNIKARLLADGYQTPIVADVHFNARVANVAALYADKVRINPGNYVDPARTFKHLEYNDAEYAAEIGKIERQLVPFLDVCRQHGTAIRIGVNHGSLSDRIMSRYGDTPEGIVESCMEFLRICQREHFDNVVISIKASNTAVMVRSVRLLADAMDKEDMHYPLHLGVTEAGEGEEGRIKSAVGIGALLADGIGDTVRVSLSEEPEAEIPVAKHLVEYVNRRAGHEHINGLAAPTFDYLRPERRFTTAVSNIGGDNVPIVIASNYVPENAESPVAQPDYIYIGMRKSLAINPKQAYIVDYEAYTEAPNIYPMFDESTVGNIETCRSPLKFLVVDCDKQYADRLEIIRKHPEIAVVCTSNHANKTGKMRAFAHEMTRLGIANPIVYLHRYSHSADEKSEFQIESAADMSALMIDGLTDGLWLDNAGGIDSAAVVQTAFAILQAARLRTTRTEYISCPGCGRTLYDLRSTIARIKAATSHMTGLKIAIMGCIVNGPGEMADADYGYVGAGRGKITLYRRKQCVAKNIPEEQAVDRLLELIESDNAHPSTSKDQR